MISVQDQSTSYVETLIDCSEIYPYSCFTLELLKYLKVNNYLPLFRCKNTREHNAVDPDHFNNEQKTFPYEIGHQRFIAKHQKKGNIKKKKEVRKTRSRKKWG